jgi:hypothetical protein
MSVNKKIVVLEQSEVVRLKKIVTSGINKARTITRARVLLMTNEAQNSGKTDKEIAINLGVAITLPYQVRIRYLSGGLERALYDAPRPGKPKHFTPTDEASVIALACTDAPDGYERWTLDLLEKEMTIRLGKSIDRNTIDRILLKNDCKPWLKKNVVHSRD